MGMRRSQAAEPARIRPSSTVACFPRQDRTLANINPKHSDGNVYYGSNDILPYSAGIAPSSSAGFFVAPRSGVSAQDAYYNDVHQSLSPISSRTIVSSNVIS